MIGLITSSLCRQSGLALTQTVGKPALSLAISAATPAVQSTQGNSGHPELAQFVKNLAAGTNTLTVTFTPDWFTDGSGLTSSEFACESPAFSATIPQDANRNAVSCRRSAVACMSAGRCASVMHLQLLRTSRIRLSQVHTWCLLLIAVATRRLSRKLRQSSYGPTGKMGTPRYRYYGRK